MKTQSNRNRLISFWLIIAALSIGAMFFKAPEVQAQAVPGKLLLGPNLPCVGTDANSILNAGTCGGASQDVQTGLATILTGAGDSVIFVSPTLPALAAGGCWEVDGGVSTNSSANITAMKIWFGSAPGTTGDSSTLAISVTSAIFFHALVCNKNASQTTQDILWEVRLQNGSGGFSSEAAGTQTASGTNLKLGLTIAGVNVIRPDKWTVKLVQ